MRRVQSVCRSMGPRAELSTGTVMLGPMRWTFVSVLLTEEEDCAEWRLLAVVDGASVFAAVGRAHLQSLQCGYSAHR